MYSLIEKLLERDEEETNIKLKHDLMIRREFYK